MALGAKPQTTLATMDADWARLAFRAPAARDTKGAAK
jgi:raffinose/stachyose/melibiose transport system substrate-binding protein